MVVITDNYLEKDKMYIDNEVGCYINEISSLMSLQYIYIYIIYVYIYLYTCIHIYTESIHIYIHIYLPIIIMMVISTITTIQVLTIQYPIRCRSHVKVSEGMLSTMLQLVGVDSVAKGSIPCMVFYSIHGAHIEVTVTNELGMNKNDIRPMY